MSFEEKTSEIEQGLKCQGCGAILTYQPGTSYLACSYCGTRNEIADQLPENGRIESTDYKVFGAAMEELEDDRYSYLAEVVHCGNCGANSRLNAHVTADLCAFCASPLIIDHQQKRIVKPHGVVPFGVDYKSAFGLLTQWAGKVWFAPNDFKRIFNARNDRLKGVYIPFWSYDADVNSDYVGSRGEYYYVTRTRRNSDGETEEYEERRTNWYPTSGTVYSQFKDIVISGSTSLPEKFSEKIGPWNLGYLRPFNEQYLSGFIAETFSVDHVKAATTARAIMDREIERQVENDIGGDTQDIDSIDSDFKSIKLKYILLPIWLSAYQYKGKSYQIMVNAFNGKVYGQRPYSFWKIAFLVFAILIVLYLLSFMG